MNMSRGFTEPTLHEHGEFLEYTWVEPERIEFLKAMLETLGTRWLCLAGNEKKSAPDFENHCAQLILKLRPFIEQARRFADKSCLSTLEGLDRRLNDAAPYIRNPALRKKRKLGDLHLDLAFTANDLMVIALRLVRRGASPVMPFKRWVGSCDNMDIWLRTLTGQPDLLHFGTRTKNVLRFYVDKPAYLLPDEIRRLLEADVASHSLGYDDYQAAWAEHNAHQKSVGAAGLYQPIPTSPEKRAKALRDYAKQQKLYRSVLTEVWLDLRWMLKGGYAYAGWSRSYDYE
jgi:hypothetical protein